MSRTAVILWMGMFLVAGCIGGQAGLQEGGPAQPDVSEPTPTVQPGDTTEPLNFDRPAGIFGMDKVASLSYQGGQLTTEGTAYFSGSGSCTNCHRDMTDQSGQDVSIDEMWRSAVMANASRDPYFKAAVKREVVDLPEYRAFIEDKCGTCHMPMARTSAHFKDEPTEMFDGGFYEQGHYLHELAMDGVSCTVCHQIQAGNLGTPESFSGEYRVDSQRPPGTRHLYGANLVTDRRAVIMAGPSGYTPETVEHIQQSEMCATCHTLFTPAVDENGEITGEFAEQMPYLEWLESSLVHEKSCQDCHMPPAESGVVLSITGGQPRSPFNQHLFVGANTYILRILRQYGQELDVNASSEAFHQKIANTQQQLEQNAARVSLTDLGMENGTLQAVVELENLAGHKLPTGFPSRRIWIHFLVKDATGKVLFESGAHREEGMILENDNDQDPAAYEPHYQVITASDQVQIYEPILQNSLGEVTTHLLRVSEYVKDNRLLPEGFQKGNVPGEIDVAGRAVSDEDFLGGGDRVMYRIELGEVEGPLDIEVELLMQSIGHRWAINHRDVGTQESDQFMSYYETVSNLPVRLAEDAQVLQVFE